MDVTLFRTEFGPNGVFSNLFEPDNDRIASCLEHSYQNEAGLWLSKIPPGAYTCQRGTHQLANAIPFVTFEIMGVPGHTGLLFHAGNFEDASEGCVLLGQIRKGNEMINSRAAFDNFMLLQNNIYQ